jgi:hypothetical protein
MAMFAAFGAVAGFANQRYREVSLVALGLSLTVLISYMVQRKGFGYHLSGLLMAFALLHAVFLGWLRDRYNQSSGKWRGAYFILLAVYIGVAVVGTGKKVEFGIEHRFTLRDENAMVPESVSLAANELNDMINIIRSNSTPSDYVYQWGRYFEVLYLAQRLPSSRFISTPALDLIDGRSVIGQSILNGVEHDLERQEPTFIVIERALLDSNNIRQCRPNHSLAFQQLLCPRLKMYAPAYVARNAILFQRAGN